MIEVDIKNGFEFNTGMEVNDLQMEIGGEPNNLDDFHATGGGITKRDVEEIKEALEKVQEQTQEFDSKYDLPNIGKPNTLYIISKENAIYRWDSKKNQYFACARDYNEIDVIDGGNAILIKNKEVKK